MLAPTASTSKTRRTTIPRMIGFFIVRCALISAATNRNRAHHTIREPGRLVKESLWVVGGGFSGTDCRVPLGLEAAQSKLATSNQQPAITKNFPALTSTVFSATLPPLERKNVRGFSLDW